MQEGGGAKRWTIRDDWEHAPGPKEILPSSEYERLMAVIAKAPGPAFWYVSTYPAVVGPRELRLDWLPKEGELAPQGRRSPAYLRLKMYSYAGVHGEDLLIVWGHIGRFPRYRSVRLNTFNTRLLEPLRFLRSRGGGGPVQFAGGLQSSIDLPVFWTAGQHDFDFPASMRVLEEILMLVTISAGRRKASEALYVVRPKDNAVDVIPLDWWNKGKFDFGYQWITRLARDPSSGNIVGEGFRIAPFLINAQSGDLISWIRPESDPP